jgi:class 3 adenylate cyclase
MAVETGDLVADLTRAGAELRMRLDEARVERDQALAQQAATIEVLQAINFAAGELAPVFDAILDRALRLCDAAFGVLWSYDGTYQRAVAIRGATPVYDAFLKGAAHQPGKGSAHGRMLAGEDLVYIPDVADSDDYRSGNPLPRALVDLGGGRSLLGVPLRKDGQFLGDIIVYRRQVRLFSEPQIAVLKGFAAQAVIAIENARLVNEIDSLRAAAERARRNLSRYFSPNVVKLLAEQDEALGAVRRQEIAVLFVDIVGFTGMSETMPPEAVVTLLRDFHLRMTAAIFAAGGTVEKYIGDAILAMFGVPEPSANDAGNALDCALQMLAALESWNEERRAAGATPLAIGIGVNHGSAVLGDVGSAQAMSFTVIGDTVNTASRLQSLTRVLKTPLVVGDPVVASIRAGGSAASAALLTGLRDGGEQVLRGRTAGMRVWVR